MNLLKRALIFIKRPFET